MPKRTPGVNEQIDAMHAELEAEIARIEAEYDPNTIRWRSAVQPKKADISVEDVALVWSA